MSYIANQTNTIGLVLPVQNRKSEAIDVISNIYDLARLEDEIDFLTAEAEQDRQKCQIWRCF